VSGKQREARAAELFAGVRRSSDPDGAVAGEIEWLERAAETAERWQVQEEEFLARAIELMRRTEHARGAATRAANERTRIEDDRRREKERRRKNALARERYAERRRTEAARVDKRTGMHALAIEVDPAAYSAVKSEALRHSHTLPAAIGEILSKASWSMGDRDAAGPRWRRTGDGRRALQHTRIDINDETWRAIHVGAREGGQTVSRWIGMAIESWAHRRDVAETQQANRT
jgi:hypothetical protein